MKLSTLLGVRVRMQRNSKGCHTRALDTNATSDIRAVQHVACYSCRIPDTARIKEKMMYASSKENLKRKLNGIQVEVQATDASEIEQSVMHEKCMALAG